MLGQTREKSRLSLGELAQDTLKLAVVWETLTEFSCPVHYNFHLHTHCSDGQLSPENLMEQATSLGLKGLAITDHHSVNGFYRAQQYLEQQQSSTFLPHLWTGVEITSLLKNTSVHILGYGFDPQAECLQIYLTGESPLGSHAKAQNVITAIKKAGGMAVLAHPFRYRRRAAELILEAYELGIDGIETYYAYGHANPWQSSSKQTAIAKELAHQYHLYTTCGTDTHGNNILLRV